MLIRNLVPFAHTRKSLIFIQDLKNIKNVKGCIGMACQKVCKQGRDDIVVKVNLQSLIPASFSH